MLSPHPLIRRTRWALAGLLAALALVGCGGAAASTASGCDWSGILRQALHNSVKATYPASCYKEAQSHESADIRTYAPWVDTDLNLAYHSALARATAQGDPPRFQQSDSSVPPVSIPLGSKGPVVNLLRHLAPSDPTAVPLPVIVLGGLTVLLLVGGASSLVVRRRLARPRRD